jgi:two-component system, cell cycle sensor histidine kinase and response regulator CckA
MTTAWKDHLRGIAVSTIARRSPPIEFDLVDLDSLRQELQVHQVELEVQNEELNRTQVELEASCERYRVLFHGAPIAYLLLDARGVILETNHLASELLGEPDEELDGQMLAQFVDPAQAEELELHRRRVMSGERASSELTLRTHQGTRLVQLESAPHDGLAARWRSALIDRTNQRRLEDQVARTRKLEAVALAASGIAHDFNNLLFGISGFADLALALAGEDNPARRPLERLKRAVANGASMVRGLFMSSRSERHRSEVLDIHKLLRRSLRMLAQVAGEEVALSLHTGAIPARVEGDPVQLDQILLNLVINARQAMPGGGSIDITTATAQVGIGQARALGVEVGRYIVVSVRDDGMGMDSDTRRRAFEPFFTTKPQGVGTGLGLATVYNIVKRHNGYLDVDSEPGSGTTIHVYLPISDAAPASRPLRRSEPPPLRVAATVLVVDDETDTRQATTHYLESAGHRVIQAAGAREALEHCRILDGAVDVIVTDMMLGDGLGTRLVEDVAQLCPRAVAVFVSGHPLEQLAEQGIAPSSRTLLAKPFDGLRLQHIVTRAAAAARREDDPPMVVVIADDDGERLQRIMQVLREGSFAPLQVGTRAAPSFCLERRDAIAFAIVDCPPRDARCRDLALMVQSLRDDIAVMLLCGPGAPQPELEASDAGIASVVQPEPLERLPRIVCSMMAQHGGDLDWTSANHGES